MRSPIEEYTFQPRAPRIPLRKRVHWALWHKIRPRTAAEIHGHRDIRNRTSLGDLSSLLKKMVGDGDLTAVKDFGSKGGTGYKRARRGH